LEAIVASTSVHFPEALADELDRIARERGVSRNRLIVEACRRVVRERDQWPPGYFSNEHLSAEDLALLERSARDFVDPIFSCRRSRAEPPL
jgi:hypothetical protein